MSIVWENASCFHAASAAAVVLFPAAAAASFFRHLFPSCVSAPFFQDFPAPGSRSQHRLQRLSVGASREAGGCRPVLRLRRRNRSLLREVITHHHRFTGLGGGTKGRIVSGGTITSIR